MAHRDTSKDRWQRIDEVFALAVETPPEARAAVLAAACSDDAELRREVERLLEADEQGRGFLEMPAAQLWLGETATADGTGGKEDEPLPAGHLLAGRYRVLSLVGRGGMGAVYRAHDAALASDVAVKVLDRSRTRDPVRVEAFRREVKLARRVSHPNVCRVHDFGEDAGSIFLTMAYVDGESLSERLRKGPLDAESCCRVLRDAGRGLAAAHDAGVIHRDLKPENVLLRRETGEAVVADFGIAAPFEDKGQASGVAGTPGYMSPEQRAGGVVDARSDVYSLGIMARQMATGRLPVGLGDAPTAERSAEVAPCRMRPDLERLVAACLQPDPADRPKDAAAVLALLEEATAARSDAGRQGWRAWIRSRPARVAIGAFLALGSACGGCAPGRRRHRPDLRWVRSRLWPQPGGKRRWPTCSRASFATSCRTPGASRQARRRALLGPGRSPASTVGSGARRGARSFCSG